MTRVGKQQERRHMNPKKRKMNLSEKTGSKKDQLKNGYKEHVNALESTSSFIPKIK